MKTAEELFGRYMRKNSIMEHTDFHQALKERDEEIIVLIDDMIKVSKEELKDSRLETVQIFELKYAIAVLTELKNKIKEGMNES